MEFMERETWYFLAPVIALLLGTAIYLAFMHPFQHYDPEGMRLQQSLELYSQLPPGSLLFFGESQVREDIDCTLIEADTDVPCFNFGIAGILPVQLALQKDLIIAAQPHRVVLGVTASFFDETLNKNDDLFMIMNGHPGLATDSFLEGKLTKNEQKLLSMNWFEKDLYKRKFFLPFYLSLFKWIIFSPPEVSTAVSNFKNPHLFTINQSVLELEARLTDPAIASIFWFENSSPRQREAFIYLISELREAGVEITIVQMPIHPLVTSLLSPESQERFQDYLENIANTYTLTIVNIEDYFAAEEFTDLTHLNSAGTVRLSLQIAAGDYHIIQ